ncbi:MAG: RNA-binding transcriptional accessory protein [Parachlamydiaceae bacterium]|nr:RNA-binding transcriptional accessory protein [Parachlamydiaceae bacterium]
MERQLNTFLISQISQELKLSNSSVQSVVKLLEEGNTIPFIARYRKEATGNLDEVQIRDIQERHQYLLELEDRRSTILQSIESQGKLTDELKAQIFQCATKNTLEDLYLPYKPKRRTRAAIAREKGLEPLSEFILSQPNDRDPFQEAKLYINAEKGVDDEDAALAGARDIAAEKIAENIDVRSLVRDAFHKEGIIVSKVITEKATGPTKFEQYYDFKEKANKIPSHRYLAIRRGEQEGILDFSIQIEAEPVLSRIATLLKLNSRSPFKKQFELAIEDAYKRLLLPSLETDMRVELKLQSDHEAVNIFGENLRHLLLSSPLGAKRVIGIDPGIRTGCKCAVVDHTGKFLETLTIYPFQGEKLAKQSSEALIKFIDKYNPIAIAIGNGTAGRETESLVRKVLQEHGKKDIIVIQVNEAGASVYSASDVAREEFPDLDLTIRGAISIARRLQDPLAELVKIDPKSIGVGQYQHDVHQPLLQDQLHQVVESCVNHVGVDINTASFSLLSYVAGIGPSLAQKIVKYRESKGPFTSRQQLREVSGFGAKTFEQATGFLRVREGENPLDMSAVHPERYDLVEQMAKDLGVPLIKLVSNNELADRIEIKRYVNSSVGELTLRDIISELKKPGRDPRSEFEPPRFRDDVMEIKDLHVGMKLEGVVTNVTAFGAFVDIGVHQDGLIHLSELSDRYIKHPSEVVKAGDKLQVEVLQIDAERKRISLTARKKSQNIETKLKEPKKDNAQSKKPFSSNPFASL